MASNVLDGQLRNGRAGRVDGIALALSLSLVCNAGVADKRAPLVDGPSLGGHAAGTQGANEGFLCCRDESRRVTASEALKKSWHLPRKTARGGGKKVLF